MGRPRNTDLLARWFACLLFGLLLTMVVSDDDNQKLSTCEFDLAQLLLLPPDSMQVQALKQELFRYLEDKMEEDELVKRSLSSLARSGNLPLYFKRNVEALARAGYLRQDADDPDMDMKRSIANLAKNGQLPTFQRTDEESKRGLESLARNGGYHNKRELDELLDDLYEKRNVGSLARGYNFPMGKRYVGALAKNGELGYMARDDDNMKRNIASIVRNGKRNMASLVRSNNLPSGKRYIFDEFKRNIASVARAMGSRYAGKRNVAALLRQDSYMNSDHSNDEDELPEPTKTDEMTEEDKRNIGSLKAQMKPKYKRSVNASGSIRNKRQAEYWQASDEYPVPVYQNSHGNDYEDLMQYLTGQYQEPDKRFLGSVARSGWFRSPVSERYHVPQKRHIGALARLGWLPALRTARRYHRSGRSANDFDYRPNSSDGSAEDNATLEENSVVDSKRYLLLPAVDNILLRRMYGSSQPVHQVTL